MSPLENPALLLGDALQSEQSALGNKMPAAARANLASKELILASPVPSVISASRTTRVRPRCRYNIPTCPGCSRRSARLTDAEYGEQFRLAHRAVGNGSASGPMAMRSPSAMRSQLREEFTSIYWPILSQDQDFVYSQFFQAEHLHPQGTTMTAAVDTLCLLYLGSYHKDEALLRQASFQRERALMRLKSDLSRGDTLTNDETQGSIWIMNFCDSFRSISRDPDLARTHVEAVSRMLQSRASEAQKSPLGRALLYNVCSSAFSFGMMYRKSTEAARLQWAQVKPLTWKPANELINLMLRVPGLLERFDNLDPGPDDDYAQDAYPLLEDSTLLETQLNSWYVRWMRTMDSPPFSTCDATTFPQFTALTEDLPDLFPKAHTFPSFATASLQIAYWIGMMQLKQTMRSLIALLQDEDLYRLRDASLLAEAEESATHLCQSIGFSSQPKYGYCGLMRCFSPMYFVRRWFADRKEYGKVEWCRVIMVRMQESSQFNSPYGRP